MKKRIVSLLAVGLILPLMSSGNLSQKRDELISNKLISEDSKEYFRTFVDVKNGFGPGLKQAAEGVFFFPTNTQEIKKIKIFIRNECAGKSCDEWDRYANVSVRKPGTNEWYEIGRFITPYWVGFEELPRGLEIDVTDFKSLLSGQTELRIYTETWLAKGRKYSVDFEFTFGKPDFRYSLVVPVFQYNKASVGTIPYGKENKIDLKRQIYIPENVEKAYLRSTISGWGHAFPTDDDGRGCSEWCFRTHSLFINGVQTFTHELGPMNCRNNPVKNQSPGNWSFNRAGWCPGMEVKPRTNELSKTLIGKNFDFEYRLQDWKNNMKNGEAFYSLSTYLILKADTPIEGAIVKE